MKFCVPHWTRLREALIAQGLEPLMVKSSEQSIAQMVDQIERQKEDANNFDPLMSCHWSIAGNVMDTLSRAGISPAYLLFGSGENEDPVDPVQYPHFAGRKWSHCPLCYINLIHEVSCTDPRCRLDKQAGYDWMLDRAVQDAHDRAVEFGLIRVV